MKIIGIDNGVTGAIAVYDTETDSMIVEDVPIKQSLLYTAKGGLTNRINYDKLEVLLHRVKRNADDAVFAYFEKPAIINNFQVVSSSHRAYEAVLIALEQNEIPYKVISSRDWQKPLFGKDKKGKELKVESFNIARQNFPTLSISKKNADAVNIAFYYGKFKRSF